MSTANPPVWMPTPDQMFAPWQVMMRKASAWPKVMEVARRTRVGATPTEAVYQDNNIRLLRYVTDVERRYKTPLLSVFALVNRPYILDLRPGKSVIAHFVNRGYDVYNVDWGVPTYADRTLSIKDYTLGFMDEMVDVIRKRSGQDKINMLGYCMGGTLSAIYAALRPEKVKNLIMLTAPVDWSAVDDSLLSVWTQEKYFDIDKVLDAFGNAPPMWLQGSFLMLKPVQNLMEKYIGFWENMEDEKYLEDFFAMETWLNDNIPVAGETFRQFVKNMFQRNELIQGRFEIDGQPVKLKNIKCPVLNLIAQNDHLVPPSQSLSFNDAVGSTDRKTVTFPAGHIGMAVGGKAHKELWPKTCEWLAERSEAV